MKDGKLYNLKVIINIFFGPQRIIIKKKTWPNSQAMPTKDRYVEDKPLCIWEKKIKIKKY